MFPLFITNGNRYFGKEEYTHQHAHIITHLRMLEESDIGEEHD